MLSGNYPSITSLVVGDEFFEGVGYAEGGVGKSFLAGVFDRLPAGMKPGFVKLLIVN
jgi:hypothetical protein